MSFRKVKIPELLKLAEGVPLDGLMTVAVDENNKAVSVPLARLDETTTITEALKGYLPLTGGTVSGSLNVTGQVKENGQRVYSPINKPTAAAIGALPLTGGTINGDLRLQTTGKNYGNKLNFGDGDYVYMREPDDDCLEIRGANEINLLTNDGIDTVMVNGTPLSDYIRSGGSGGGGKMHTIKLQERHRRFVLAIDRPLASDEKIGFFRYKTGAAPNNGRPYLGNYRNRPARGWKLYTNQDTERSYPYWFDMIETKNGDIEAYMSDHDDNYITPGDIMNWFATVKTDRYGKYVVVSNGRRNFYLPDAKAQVNETHTKAVLRCGFAVFRELRRDGDNNRYWNGRYEILSNMETFTLTLQRKIGSETNRVYPTDFPDVANAIKTHTGCS